MNSDCSHQQTCDPQIGRVVCRSSQDTALSVTIHEGHALFLQHYALGDRIGGGGFGHVHRARRLSDNVPVVVKTVRSDRVPCWCQLDSKLMPMEVVLLSMCQGIPGIVNLLEVYNLDQSWVLIMDNMSHLTCDMFDYIGERGTLTEKEAAHYLYQLCGVLLSCHKVGVLHRDIKDENILIDRTTNDLILIDFGSGAFLQSDLYTDFDGTRVYCPPEWILNRRYDGKQAEIWSLGVLLYDMLCGDIPFTNDKGIISGKLRYRKSTLSEPAKNLIEQCLSMDPNARPTLCEILRHPWMVRYKPNLNKRLPDPVLTALRTLDAMNSPCSAHLPLRHSFPLCLDSENLVSTVHVLSNSSIANSSHRVPDCVSDGSRVNMCSASDSLLVSQSNLTAPVHQPALSPSHLCNLLPRHSNVVSCGSNEQSDHVPRLPVIQPHRTLTDNAPANTMDQSEASSGYYSRSDSLSSNEGTQALCSPVISTTAPNNKVALLADCWSTSSHAVSMLSVSSVLGSACSALVTCSYSLSCPVAHSVSLDRRSGNANATSSSSSSSSSNSSTEDGSMTDNDTQILASSRYLSSGVLSTHWSTTATTCIERGSRDYATQVKVGLDGVDTLCHLFAPNSANDIHSNSSIMHNLIESDDAKVVHDCC